MVPTLATELLKSKADVQVAAGNNNTVRLTADDLVFVCSNGAGGQLGIGDTEDRVVPTLVRGELGRRKVLGVARVGGALHTMCVHCIPCA